MSVAAYRAWETMREQDERVTVNIEPHLLPLWRRVKSTFKGEAPHARFEAFMEWAETDEGQRAMLEAVQDDADQKLDELLRAEVPIEIRNRRSEAARKANATRRRSTRGRKPCKRRK